MYFFIDKSDFDVMLKTWSNTDIPPNPSKNAQMMILEERALLVTELTSNTPLVSSIIPEINLYLRALMVCIISMKIFLKFCCFLK